MDRRTRGVPRTPSTPRVRAVAAASSRETEWAMMALNSSQWAMKCRGAAGGSGEMARLCLAFAASAPAGWPPLPRASHRRSRRSTFLASEPLHPACRSTIKVCRATAADVRVPLVAPRSPRGGGDPASERHGTRCGSAFRKPTVTHH
jgi:hypothetical protein